MVTQTFVPITGFVSEVLKLFVEDGKNNESNDDDPFKVSDVNTMLNYLKG